MNIDMLCIRCTLQYRPVYVSIKLNPREKYLIIKSSERRRTMFLSALQPERFEIHVFITEIR